MRKLLLLMSLTGLLGGIVGAEEWRAGCWDNGQPFDTIQSKFSFNGETVSVGFKNNSSSAVTLLSLAIYQPSVRFKKAGKIIFLTPDGTTWEETGSVLKEAKRNAGFVNSAYLCSMIYFADDVSQTILQPNEQTQITETIKTMTYPYSEVDNLLRDNEVKIQFSYELFLGREGRLWRNQSHRYHCYSDWLSNPN